MPAMLLRSSVATCAHVISTALRIVAIYVGVIMLGGTLINTREPVLVEIGFFIQDLTSINALIRWADATDHHVLLGVLLAIGDGMPIPHAA